MALSQLHFDEAKAKGQEALDAAGSEYRDVVLLAKSTIGLATALSGKAQQARKLCEEAVVIAKEVKISRLESSALLALAEVQLASNDATHALLTIKQVQANLSTQQQDSQWQSWLIAARANELAGNRSEAQACALRAEAICTGLRNLWGPESYESYLRRPDIENYRKQLTQILARTK
jgi:hypothetical protein